MSEVSDHSAMMGQSRLVALLGYAITACAIIAISLLVTSPASRTSGLWYRLTWICALMVIPWFHVAQFLVCGRPQHPGRPHALAAAIVSHVYIALSVVTLVLSEVLPSWPLFSMLHLAIQVGLTSAWLLILLLLRVSFRAHFNTR